MHQHSSGLFVQRFRPASTPLKPWLLGILGFSVACSLIFPARMLAAPTAAAPTAKWTNPWKFTPIVTGIAGVDRGVGINQWRSGGLGAANEVLPGTDALIQAESAVVSSSNYSSFASILVNFERPFRLSDSPRGWDTKLTLSLNGRLVASSKPMALNSMAEAQAHAKVGETLKVDFFKNVDVISPRPEELVKGADHSETVLQDGTYTVTGTFLTKVSEALAFTSEVRPAAIADFSHSFSVGVTANPVVPENINLVGAFAVLGFCGLIWFRRSRALPCS
jgi:hypothetical protein